MSIDVTYNEPTPAYFVFAVGGSAPSRSHRSRISATNEARRLADKQPGVQFHVVKLKASVINGDSTTPVGGTLPPHAVERQMAAREGMAPGRFVRVNNDHHATPGQMGYIERLGEGNDTSVYVTLKSEPGVTHRFAPTSLTLLKSNREQEPEAKTTSPKIVRGSIVQDPSGHRYKVLEVYDAGRPSERYEMRDLADREVTWSMASDGLISPVMSETEPKAEDGSADTEPKGKPDLLGLLAAGIVAGFADRLRANMPVEDWFMPGEEVFVMTDVPTLFGGLLGFAERGWIASYEGNESFRVTFEDTPFGARSVPAKRILKKSDPRIRALGLAD